MERDQWDEEREDVYRVREITGDDGDTDEKDDVDEVPDGPWPQSSADNGQTRLSYKSRSTPTNSQRMHDPDLEKQLEEHHGAAFGWALSCCGWDRATAQDVLQTAYLKVVQGRARFAGRSSFKTFLFGVIRRTAAEHRRATVLRRVLPLSWLDGRPEGQSAATDPGMAVERSEQAARLVEALRELPQRQREVLHLVFYEDLSIAEAAHVIGVSLGTGRTHYERGKQRLRELLRGERG